MDSGAASRKGFYQVGFDGRVPLSEPRVLFELYLEEMVA